MSSSKRSIGRMKNMNPRKFRKRGHGAWARFGGLEMDDFREERLLGANPETELSLAEKKENFVNTIPASLFKPGRGVKRAGIRQESLQLTERNYETEESATLVGAEVQVPNIYLGNRGLIELAHAALQNLPLASVGGVDSIITLSPDEAFKTSDYQSTIPAPLLNDAGREVKIGLMKAARANASRNRSLSRRHRALGNRGGQGYRNAMVSAFPEAAPAMSDAGIAAAAAAAAAGVARWRWKKPPPPTPPPTTPPPTSAPTQAPTQGPTPPPTTSPPTSAPTVAPTATPTTDSTISPEDYWGAPPPTMQKILQTIISNAPDFVQDIKTPSPAPSADVIMGPPTMQKILQSITSDAPDFVQGIETPSPAPSADLITGPPTMEVIKGNIISGASSAGEAAGGVARGIGGATRGIGGALASGAQTAGGAIRSFEAASGGMLSRFAAGAVGNAVVKALSVGIPALNLSPEKVQLLEESIKYLGDDIDAGYGESKLINAAARAELERNWVTPPSDFTLSTIKGVKQATWSLVLARMAAQVAAGKGLLPAGAIAGAGMAVLAPAALNGAYNYGPAALRALAQPDDKGKDGEELSMPMTPYMEAEVPWTEEERKRHYDELKRLWSNIKTWFKPDGNVVKNMSAHAGEPRHSRRYRIPT